MLRSRRAHNELASTATGGSGTTTSGRDYSFEEDVLKITTAIKAFFDFTDSINPRYFSSPQL